MSKRRKIRKIPSSSVVPPPSRSKRKERRKINKVNLRKIVLKPEVSEMEKLDVSKKELFGRKLRLESLLRVLYKFKQFGIPNEEYTMTQLNQKVEEIDELLEEINEALSGWENKHFLEASQADVNLASTTDEAFGEDDVFVNGDGVCIFCRKLPAMCNGGDLYTAIAAIGRKRVIQGLFGEGSAVERVKRVHQMG